MSGEQVWWMCAGAALCATGVFFELPTESQSVLYDVIGASAGIAMLVGIHRHRPRARAASFLLAAGIVVLSAGDVDFGSSQSVPSPADVLYISACPYWRSVSMVLPHSLPLADANQIRSRLRLSRSASGWSRGCS